LNLQATAATELEWGDGFDPAPGDPDTIEAAARECVRSAQDLGADADLRKRLTEHIDWQGEAADASCWGGADVFDARGERHGATVGTLARNGYSAVARRRGSDWATPWLSAPDVVATTSASPLGRALFLLGAANLLADFEHFVYGPVDFEHATHGLRLRRPARWRKIHDRSSRG
jgi:hypothetical protein